MFQTVFSSIIRSSKLHIQRQVFVRPLLLPAASLARVAAGRLVWQYLTLYVQFWAPDDGRKNHLKHVERLTEINKLWNFASCWLYSASANIFFSFWRPNFNRRWDWLSLYSFILAVKKKKKEMWSMEMYRIKQRTYERFFLLFWVKCILGDQNVLCSMCGNLVQKDNDIPHNSTQILPKSWDYVQAVVQLLSSSPRPKWLKSALSLPFLSVILPTYFHLSCSLDAV